MVGLRVGEWVGLGEVKIVGLMDVKSKVSYIQVKMMAKRIWY